MALLYHRYWRYLAAIFHILLNLSTKSFCEEAIGQPGPFFTGKDSNNDIQTLIPKHAPSHRAHQNGHHNVEGKQHRDTVKHHPHPKHHPGSKDPEFDGSTDSGKSSANAGHGHHVRPHHPTGLHKNKTHNGNTHAINNFDIIRTQPKDSQRSHRTIYVYHMISFDNGMLYNGNMNCHRHNCVWKNSENIDNLIKLFKEDSVKFAPHDISVGMYNIHHWWSKGRRKTHPMPYHLFPTNLSIVESEESRGFHGTKRFDSTFPNFDAFSTTNPKSPIQRVYIDAYMKYYRPNMLPNHDMIPGGSFVVQDCREGFPNESGRFRVVQQLRDHNTRVDGLGKCLASNPDNIKISDSNSDFESKRTAISKYMFHMAFENTLEEGYVTEKAFDALMAGTVPVYLGDSSRLRELLPLSPGEIVYDYSNGPSKSKKLVPLPRKAAIFVDDFPNIQKLSVYLNYLISNRTAYEEHRAWRLIYSPQQHHQTNKLLQTTWPCQVCSWADENADKLGRFSIKSRSQ